MKKRTLLVIICLLLVTLVGCKQHGTRENQALAKSLTHKLNQDGKKFKVSIGKSLDKDRKKKGAEVIVATITDKKVLQKFKDADAALGNDQATQSQKQYLLKYHRLIIKEAKKLKNPADVMSLGNPQQAYVVATQKGELSFHADLDE